MDRIFDSLYREVRLAQAKFPHRIWSSLEEHQAVADAILAGDVDHAEGLMRAHLRFGERFALSGSTSYGSRAAD